MSSTQEASPRKESGRKPASKERTQRAVTANANANADGASPSPQPPQRRRRGRNQQQQQQQQQQNRAPRSLSPPRPRPGAPKVIVLAGPTASGKSAVSLRLAELLEDGIEVVNADSVQVYRGLDVGSAKLPVEERRGVPHHLLDVADPVTDDFSAGSFYSLARAAIDDVLSRGKVPVVVGGTGLYLRWLVHGRPSTKPASDEGKAWAKAAFDAAVAAAEAAKRKEMMGLGGGDGGEEGKSNGDSSSSSVLTREERWAAACSALAAAGDPAAAERILKELNNEYRLLRALAALHDAGPGVTLASLDAPGLAGGVKRSDKRREEREEEVDDDEDEEAGADDAADAAADPAAQPSSRSPSPSSPPPSPTRSRGRPLLDYDFRCFFLHAPSREAAYRRIDARAEAIVAGGLFGEAAGLLLARGARPASCSATRAIGYRQAMEGILEVLGRGGGGEEGGVGDYAPPPSPPLPTPDDVRAVAAATQAASRRLAHSQYTWFRGDPLYRWVAVSVPEESSSDGGGGRGDDDNDPISAAAAEIAASFALPSHDPSATSSSSSLPPPPSSDGRLTKEEEQALRRYVPRLTLLATERGMRDALESLSAAVEAVPEAVARAAREEAARRRRQRESNL